MDIVKFIKELNHERLRRRHERHLPKASERRVKKVRAGIPAKVRALRKKDKIRVLFVVHELASWKTETLYLAMKKHPRFEVNIGITFSLENTPSQNISAVGLLIDYLKEKSYDYTELAGSILETQLCPDIIFYQKPYYGVIADRFFVKNKSNALFCYAQYAFNTLTGSWTNNKDLHLMAWQLYYENEAAAECAKKNSFIKGRNFRVTGLPFQDELMTPKEAYHDPWKKQDREKKRIIWAPHHSIDPENYIHFSTFMSFADTMLELAEKYKDAVQFVFKPHPVLAKKLGVVWGEERRKAYYERWDRMENGQLCEGKYIDLFKYSDAMIHDCCSFMVEYHYTLNPVMYLTGPCTEHDNFMPWAEEAFSLHYMGRTREDIEKFIINVIEGEDPMRKTREEFYRKNLVPPHGKTACENIIDSILELSE